MKKMNKFLTYLLVVIMAVGMVAYAAPAFAEDEPLVINWLAYNHVSGVLPDPENPVLKLIEEKYNIKINLEQVNIHDDEQRALYWASGAEPDYISFQGSGSKKIGELIDQGLLRSIPDGYYETYMPDYIKLITESYGEDIMDQCYYGDGYYVLPYTYTSWPYLMGVRKDWMDKLGITELPTNEDELFELLKAFTFDDPDGNGVDDTYGLHCYYKGFGMGSSLAMRNTAYASYWLQDDGSVIYTSATEEYRDALRLFNTWYEAGVIDPEFTTDDRVMQRNKWTTDKLGAIVDDSNWWLDGTANNLVKILKDANPDAEVAFIEPFTNADGIKSVDWYPTAINSDGCSAFGASCSDEKMQIIMQFRNDLATDQDFYDRVYWGVEGEDFTKDENGLITANPDSVTPENIAAKGINVVFGLVPDCEMILSEKYSEKDMALWQFSLDADRMILNGTNFVTTETNQALNDYGADVQTITEEYWFNAITGVKNLDSDWDAYVESLNAAGLQKICDEYAEILK